MKKVEVIAYNKGYRVNSLGLLLNPKGLPIGTKNGNGYINTRIRYCGENPHLTCHRLQAYQKYGNNLYKKGIMVRHLDGDPLNNCWENIAIGTHSDNMMDIPADKRRIRAGKGKRKHNYLEIRTDKKKGLSYTQLMSKYKISSKGTISYIINSSMPDKY